MTFFPHPQARQARAGKGAATEIRFEIAKSAIGFWLDRLATLNIAAERTQNAFDSHVIRFQDPDGIILELVGVDNVSTSDVWITDNITAENAIRGFHSTVIWADSHAEETIALLRDVFDFTHSEKNRNTTRLSTGNTGLGQIVDVYHDPDSTSQTHRGMMGAGAIHHIAFRATDDAHENIMRDRLIEKEFNVTPVIDRYYFQSVYFREPSGVIFEIATDQPGFTVDEPLDTLGTELKLPPHLEDQRAEIEKHLVPLDA